MCLPTRSEGFSTTLLEAAACGCPAVVTDVGGVQELIPDETYGTVIGSLESRSIIEAVVGLADDATLRHIQSLRFSKKVRERCGWASTAALVEISF